MGTDDSGGRYSQSREMLARASRWMPQGVSSPFRARAPVPLSIANAAGCHFTDVQETLDVIDAVLARMRSSRRPSELA